MRYPKRPWKKSFRRVPCAIRCKLEEISDNPLKVVGDRKVPKDEIAMGHFEPLGISLNADGTLVLPQDPVIPPSENGTWARRNREGWTILRTDLPKAWRSFSHEVPNFGDYSRGTHDYTYERECYQREVVPQFGLRCMRSARAIFICFSNWIRFCLQMRGCSTGCCCFALI